MNTKVCSKCSETKPIDEFAKVKGTDRVRSECRLCGNKMCRDYKARNRAKTAVYNKIYKSDHADEIRESNRAYVRNNIEMVRVKRNAYHQEKRDTDPIHRISCEMRSITYALFKGSKRKASEDLVGCKAGFFVAWIQYQFNENMTMENYGSYWHFDHVDPCNTFDLTNDEQKGLCAHWSNLRPLEASLNQSRSDDSNPVEIMEQHQVYLRFLEERTFVGPDDPEDTHTLIIN